MSNRCDVIVIGAGIAGASAAAELAGSREVVLLEMEFQPGYHSTGRSAAYFAAAYGNAVIRGISATCESFFRDPPDGFCDVDLLRPRDCLFIGRADQRPSLQAMQAENPSLEVLGRKQIVAQVPVIKSDYVDHGLLDSMGGDLDVDAVLQGYLRLLRRRGGTILTRRRVEKLSRSERRWTIEAAGETYTAPTVVNAAGAWADPVARLAGIEGLGIVPKRRTALLIDPPPDTEIDDWPLVIDVDEEFYFKPDAGMLLVSPADETESPPCDAQPEELDIAIAVDRFETVTGIDVERVVNSWAGLRSFARDKVFVVGEDPRAPGFYWLAGQGGYGVMTAPALAVMLNHLVTEAALAGSYAPLGEFIEAVAPDRLL